MTEHTDLPDAKQSERPTNAPSRPVADAYQGNWVDEYAPAWSRPYLRLSRADRPIGTWLLLLPCWWGVLLAALSTGSFNTFDVWIMVGCAGGAFLMRGAGCTWNDITDRHIDAQVARTRSRPIPSGQVSPKQAAIWMAVQALLSLAILLTFNKVAILLGVLSLAPVAVYPFAKRFTWWPQVFLGLAFNWGALLAWSAHTGSLAWPGVALYTTGIAWTLFYDTIYAHQDTEDDALIGVKSTALLFGAQSRKWLLAFLLLTVGLLALSIAWALAPVSSRATTLLAFAGPLSMGLHLLRQWHTLDTQDPENCLHLFRTNRDAGLLPALFFAIALMV